jgi:hypothetical protein
VGRYVHEGNTKVTFVATLASTTAPSAATLTAGTELSTLLTKDGLQTPDTQNMVDSSTLADTFDAQVVGSWGGSITLTGFRDNVPANDDLWDLAVYGTTGFIVIRRGVPYDDAWASGDLAEVYPVQFHEPVPNQSGANEEVRFTLACAVTDAPEKRAVVAA